MALQAVNKSVVAKKAKAQVEESKASSDKNKRRDLLAVAARSLKSISANLKKAVLDTAPAASPDRNSPAEDWALILGEASLGIDPAKQCTSGMFGRYAPPFDVIAYAAVGVNIPPDRHQFYGRSHSLWYGDLQRKGVYRWFEFGFMVSPLIPRSLKHVPGAMDPSEDSGMAFATALTEWALARPVEPIDQGEEDQFIERWMAWLADGAAGNLNSPRSLPEGKNLRDSYRKK